MIKNSIEMEKYYIQDIQDNLEKHQESGLVSLDYLEHSTAKYHGKTIYSLYVPKFISEETELILKDAAETMANIMRKVIKEYQKNEKYRKLFGFSKELEELILINPNYDNVLPVCRVDIFLNEETGGYYFCELNTDGSSSMNEDRELCLAFEKTYLYKQLSRDYELNSFELFDSLVDAFLDNYQSYKYKVDKPNIAIVDFLELGCSNEEFEQFRLCFEKRGLNAVICDIRDLSLMDDGLYSDKGMKIDLIYRRAVTSDIMEHKNEVWDFVDGILEEKVCCMGNFCTQVVHDKSLFYILRDEQTKAILSQNENEFIDLHIPYTEELTLEIVKAKKILENKNQWLIKPKNSYGARGIFAGVNFTRDEWEKIVYDHLDKNVIVQQFIMPYQSENIDFHKEDPKLCKYSNLTGLYVYNGKFSGVYSRQANHEIISSSYDENDIATIRYREKK